MTGDAQRIVKPTLGTFSFASKGTSRCSMDMATGYRITAGGGAVIGEADTMDGVIAFAKSVPPGRYWIEQLSLNPATGDIRCVKWGTFSKDRKGAIKLAFPDSTD